MPYSSESGKQYIKDVVKKLQPQSILDIGAGSGTYRELLKDDCAPKAFWHGVEIWRPYIEKFDLFNRYDVVTIADACEYDFPREYDLCILGDVLEHMEKDKAVALFAKMRKICKTVIVSIPVGHYPQDEFEGNPYERHVTDNWTKEDLIQTFGDPASSVIENEIAVFVYRKLKIAIYAISKNEEMFVKRFCESSKEADVVLIADTGSTDKTVELAKECGATVHNIFVSPWRFDIARDTALTLIPADIDVCISLDLDEVMQPGWREEIERVWKEDTTRLRYKFDWGCGIAFYYEKIHHRKGYHWHHPVHEYPVPDMRTNEVWAHTDMLLVVHQPDPTKSRGQYMPLLELAVKEDPHCPRNAFYHARELTFYYRWEEAITALNRYLSLPGATWQNERCYAMRLLGKAYEHTNRHWEAIKYYQMACAEAPYTREPWVDLATFSYMKQDWQTCYYASKKALEIKDKQAVYTMDPSVWTEKPYDLCSIAAWHLGHKEEARQMCIKALEFAPSDSRLLKNLEAITETENG